MMTTQQQNDLGKQLADAALQAAMPADDIEIPTFAATDQQVNKSDENGKTGAASPLNGVRTPSGRPKGVRNKLTNLRDAVLEAFDRVGGADYLVRLAEGTQSDRAAFVSLMNKVLPTQINQSVDGGIKLELSWLGSRSIGTTTAQVTEQRTQVLDLEQDSEGQYRIKHPNGGGDAQPAGEGGTPPTAQNDAQGPQGA